METCGLVLVIARARDSNGATEVVVVEDHSYPRINPKFPGGRIEPGESPIEAGVRELEEETALEAQYGKNIRVLGKTSGANHKMERYPVYFVGVDFDAAYALRYLASGYRSGKLIAFLTRVPVYLEDRDRFLARHRTWLKEASEEAYADLFVPTYG